MYISTSPFWLRWLYPTLVWQKNSNERSVYLTFDDGPIPDVTPFVLNTLKNFNARATFFCIGDNIEKFPEVYQEVLANGHAVGNHTFSHLRGWDVNDQTYFDDISKCARLVRSKLFRPPYGRIKRSQIRTFFRKYPGYEIIMWDVLSGDFDERIDAIRCISNVLKNVRNGSIIVFHDSLKAYPRLKGALPVILRTLAERGFEFKTL